MHERRAKQHTERPLSSKNKDYLSCIICCYPRRKAWKLVTNCTEKRLKSIHAFLLSKYVTASHENSYNNHWISQSTQQLKKAPQARFSLSWQQQSPKQRVTTLRSWDDLVLLLYLVASSLDFSKPLIPLEVMVWGGTSPWGGSSEKGAADSRVKWHKIYD